MAPFGGHGRTAFRATLAAMSGQTDEPLYPPAPDLPPEPVERAPAKKRQRTAAEAALPWLLGVLVVLLLASSGGLVTAWIVASMKAAPPPAAAGPTPTFRPPPTIAPTPGGQQTPGPTAQPLHTPTAAPVITPEPQPYVHVVQRGETLLEIADMYSVDIAEILALNPDIVNENRIFRGQEILIPGDAIRPTPKP